MIRKMQHKNRWNLSIDNSLLDINRKQVNEIRNIIHRLLPTSKEDDTPHMETGERGDILVKSTYVHLVDGGLRMDNWKLI